MGDRLLDVMEGVRRRFHDVGDGTHAPAVYLAGSPAIGAPTDAPWNGTDSSASLISIMKYCGQQLALIADNTSIDNG